MKKNKFLAGSLALITCLTWGQPTKQTSENNNNVPEKDPLPIFQINTDDENHKLSLSVKGGQIVFEIISEENEGDLTTLQKNLQTYLTLPEASELWQKIFDIKKEQDPSVFNTKTLTFPIVLNSETQVNDQTGSYSNGQISIVHSNVEPSTLHHESIHYLQDLLYPKWNSLDSHSSIASYISTRLMAETEAKLQTLFFDMDHNDNFNEFVDISYFIHEHKDLSQDDLKIAFTQKFYPWLDPSDDLCDQMIDLFSNDHFQMQGTTITTLRQMKKQLPPEEFKKQAIQYYFDHMMCEDSEWKTVYVERDHQLLSIIQMGNVCGKEENNPQRLPLEQFLKKNPDKKYVEGFTKRLLKLGLRQAQIEELLTVGRNSDFLIQEVGKIAQQQMLEQSQGEPIPPKQIATQKEVLGQQLTR